MFGYINPDAPYLFIKDDRLYKALYCGLCKSIGKGCGQNARAALTYDMAFMSALIHNIRREDVEIKNRRCAVHIFKRRPMCEVDETSVMLGCINTALAYYKLLDDKADGDKRAFFRHFLKRGFKRAKKKHAPAVEIIREQTLKQTELERANCAIIDMACEPTAVMMQRLSIYALGQSSTKETEALFYDLGKWIYLADALDDFEKDVKKGRYNVLRNAFACADKCAAIENNKEEIDFIFNSLFADMRARISKIEFAFNRDLTDNIILRGIPLKTRSLLKCECSKRGDKNERKKS